MVMHFPVKWVEFVLSYLLSLPIGQHPHEITYADVRSGQGLEYARPVPVSRFCQLLLSVGRIKPEGWDELYQDSGFVYFGYRYAPLRTWYDYVKVNRKDLTDSFPGYKDVKGWELSRYLWDTVMPDQDRMLYGVTECPKKWKQLKYEYTLEDKKVRLTLWWTINRCSGLADLEGKSYTLLYDPFTRIYSR